MAYGFHRNPATKANRLRSMKIGDSFSIPETDISKWRNALTTTRRSSDLLDWPTAKDWSLVGTTITAIR